MICPNCKKILTTTNIETCPWCGFKLLHPKWAVVTKEYPPNDIILESLLKAAGIPVQLARKEITGFPVSVGPLAEVKILVPENMLAESKAIIEEFKKSNFDENLSPKEE